MGLFSRNNESKVIFPWKEITSVAELTACMENAVSKPVVLFKHSTRCSISIMALKLFQKEWILENDKFDLCYVDLLAHRDVSNELEKLSSVQHQSPQAIVWFNNEVLYSATHSGISATEIQALSL